MRGLFLILILIGVLFGTYFDLSKGTLPKNLNKLNSYAYKVQPQDTIITIVSKHDNGLNVSFEQLVDDFHELNKGTEVYEIKVGNTYLFPSYTK